MDLVEKACLEVLLGDGGGSDGYVSRAGHGAGLFEGALYTVAHDGPIGAGTDVLVGRVVGQQEEGSARRVVTAPAVGNVEGAPSGNDRTAVEHLPDHRETARREV